MRILSPAGGFGPSAHPWAPVAALTLFMIDVPMIGVLYNATSLVTVAACAMVTNLAAAEAVCRLFGRPSVGVAAVLLKLARALLVQAGGACAVDL